LRQQDRDHHVVAHEQQAHSKASVVPIDALDAATRTPDPHPTRRSTGRQLKVPGPVGADPFELPPMVCCRPVGDRFRLLLNFERVVLRMDPE
jgi:hypothetical protein